uniref:Serine-protein kinase ATM n=1 Tax=Equus asinus asinus TaxID=83772 RepID=A0A8C4LRV0_EQUAS
MSLALNDLLICCRQLGHDRATERRKEVEKFKRLIRDPETVKQLDQHLDSKQGKYLNWDAVFRFLQKYIQKEIEHLRTAKPNVSASTQAGRQKKMQEISSLVKYFIKCANKRAPKLKCQELLNYIMDTMKDSSNGAISGADCSNILLKDILSVRKYWCEISQQQWLYLKPSQDINRVLVARIIQAVTKGCCSQTDGLNSKFLEYFSKAIQQEKSSAGLSHILAAFILFLKTLAVNFRIQVCELGDEILPTLLYVWTQHRPNDSLKEVMIELFQLQIYIHHPKGAKTQEKGAYESRKWKSILYNLYDLLVNEISHIGSRGKYSSGSRNIAVKENLIELMADIYTKSLEISHVSCKKRKIELGWEVINDHLQKSQNDFDLVPWLQIATQLISKYPASLPNCELSPLLMILCQLLPQQRRGERTPYVLRCLMEVALCQGKKSNLESSQKSDLLKLWDKIWCITFRGISSEQIQAENFGLLGAIIQGSLIEVDREFWKLFTGSACKPSFPAVCCLTLALTICVVPETVKTGMEQNICEVNRSSSLKELIMKWLLFYQLEDDFEDSTELPPILHRYPPLFDTKWLYFTLIMQDFPELALNIKRSLCFYSVLCLFNVQCIWLFCPSLSLNKSFLFVGAINPLAEEHLSKQDLLFLDMLKFLCMCVTSAQTNTVSFRAADIRRKLLMLLDSSMLDPAKSLHLHMYLVLLKELPGEEYSLPMGDVVELLKPLSNVCSLYHRDQDVCKTVLNHVLHVVMNLRQGNVDAENTKDAQERFLKVIEADPYSKWAILKVNGNNFPVNEVFPQFLADDHHQVRMLAAELFQDMEQGSSSRLLKALPLKLQQTAFENAYLKAQEGMRQRAENPELLDDIYNRKAVLLMMIAVVLCCSPVCEKQALFALCKSVKDDGLEPHLVKKVLEKVSETFGYRNLEDFMASHLDYLILEWLNLRDNEYSLSSFPFILLNYANVEDFYRSCYKVLIPHLVIRSDFDEVKSIANQIQEDWKSLLTDCFPKILVNILPYFAYEDTGDSGLAQQRETATKVYDMLKDENVLGKQIDHLFRSNLPEIVVELLMTLHEPATSGTSQSTDLCDFSGDLDPAPNPPHFPSHVIKATFAYISSCHKTKLKSIVEILSKSPDSYQKILLAICVQAAETNNIYKKHRILKIYHLFVSLLLKDIKSGLGGAWAFVLRDVIYTLIHYINKRPSPFRDVSLRSFSLCCDLLSQVCHTAVTYCKDALESHLHVIVGTLIPLVDDQMEVQKQVLDLLKYLVIDNKDNENLYMTIKLLDPFPDHVVFKDLRITQQKIKYSGGPFSLLEEINHFLSVSKYDALPLTRLEGLKDLRRQLEQHKDQMMDLMRASQDNPQGGIMVKLVVGLLQLSKMAINHTGEREVLEAVGSCLGELGPIDFSTIAVQHSKDTSYTKALELFEDKELQWTFIMLTYLNDTLVEDCVKVRSAAVTCLKNILATKTGHSFWEIYKKTTDPMLIYLHPFRTSRKKFLEVPRIDKENPLEGLDDTSLWIPQSKNHDIWIKTLTCAVLDSGGTKSEILQLLKPMCEVKTDFCQTVLPYLIHDILLQDTNESWRNLLSTHIQGFFTNCFRHSSQTSRSTTPANLDSEHIFRGCLDKKSQRTMLAIVDYMRRQKRPSSGTVFDDAFWLELNYLEVAKVAQSCAAHFTALLYAEIYADKKSMEDQEKRSTLVTNRSLTFEEGSQSTTISSLSEKSKEESGISLQDLLLEIYRSIGEPDSLYGCGGGKMLQPLTRLRTYEHEAMWGKALVTYDLETAISSSTRQAGIIQALQNLGLCHILSVYLKGLDHENKEWCAELQELHYQAAWRNMQWDHSEGASYHKSLYNALQSLRDREFSTFYESLKYARVKEVEELCKGSLESVYSLYPTLSRLQTIGESVTDRQPSEVYIKWRKHSQLLKDSDFSFQEPIMALRTVILEILMEKEMESSQRQCFKDILTKHLVELSTLARTFKNTQLPERAIFQIKQYNSASCGVSEWQLEEAQVFWAKEEQSLALSILKQMIKKLDNDPNLKLMYTECLRICGNWLAETCLENPAVIMQTYLEKAVEVAGNCDGESNDELRNGKMKAFLSLARFSDTQYQRIENYMKSSEFENKQALLKRAKEEVGLLREHKIQTNRYTIKVQRELELDECALRALKEDRKRFLCKAVENYISCLLSGEGHDMWIFRLCSLWLENSGVSEVNGMMKANGIKIPSYKFLPLMYQLAARMGTKMMGGLGFHEVLNNLISRISMDHPHHTLFIILALANANKDEFLTKPEAARRSRITKSAPKQSSQLDEDRTEAANKIVHTIRSRRPQMIRSVEALCDAYIILANLDATQWRTQRQGINIPADQPITKLQNLEDVVVPTMEIKVDPTGEYENLVTIQSFKAEFRLAGGLNLPKIIDCLGSDGKERRQLVKGRDDLRQDAVMQQVFQMCNTLLQRNTETRKRKLTICTYKVVPLSQRSGVLEWCTGTVPIGEFLVNNENGAHKRYRPEDFSALQCQKKMMDVQKKSFEEKYATFMDICQNFQPVFRYFCMEKFLDPAVWFEKRLAYTRSVATSSIVGYILGLGDRHVQNILINEQSAELVHIDLGVAFEQGKILPTPETVPFRLTRDIVDGMGITGVEGVFRRCCEKTMEVMRNSQETLLTIVEVLLYDPLFDWTMNPLKALYLQQRPEDETELHSTPHADDQECKRNLSDVDQSFNKVAERVLMRLQEKLKGVEEGTVLSVGGQVNLLIQQAMDPKNLSRLFPGWKAWV